MERLLILEDDERLCETLATLLSNKFKVHTADCVSAGAKLFATTKFDAVISDFVLADGDGFNVLNLVNNLLPRPKLFFITAHAEKDMAVKLLNENVDGFLEKPFDFSKLLSLIENELPQLNAEPVNKIKLIPQERQAAVGSQVIDLTEVELKIISYLISQKCKWLSRQEMIQHIWGDSIQSRNALDTHLTNLKRKIPSLKEELKVVRGRGYLYSPM